MSQQDTNDEKEKSTIDFALFCQQFSYHPKVSKKRPYKHAEKVETSPIDPFVAPSPFKYRDKFSTPCKTCFINSLVCKHNPEKQLKLLIIGHNPSEHAWKSGNMYSNPTNRMWKVLTGNFAPETSRGIIKNTLSIEDQNCLPKEYGIGFCDLGVVPGNQADSFSKEELTAWRADLFKRLKKHLQRVCKEIHNDSTCSLKCHSPQIVLFSGKSQFCTVMGHTTISMGLQSILPLDWPFSKDCKVYVCPSTSGRCGLKKEIIASYYEEVFKEYRLLSLVFLNKQIKPMRI